jgi:hypothetical protein
MHTDRVSVQCGTGTMIGTARRSLCVTEDDNHLTKVLHRAKAEVCHDRVERADDMLRAPCAGCN